MKLPELLLSTAGEWDESLMASDHVTYDEIEDVLTSTDLLAMVALQLDERPSLWKWMITAAQNGLQGAILQGAIMCALHDGVGVSILTEKSAHAVLAWHDGR